MDPPGASPGHRGSGSASAEYAEIRDRLDRLERKLDALAARADTLAPPIDAGVPVIDAGVAVVVDASVAAVDASAARPPARPDPDADKPVDCSASLAVPFKDKRFPKCRAQLCKAHPGDARCDL